MIDKYNAYTCPFNHLYVCAVVRTAHQLVTAIYIHIYIIYVYIMKHLKKSIQNIFSKAANEILGILFIMTLVYPTLVIKIIVLRQTPV